MDNRTISNQVEVPEEEPEKKPCFHQDIHPTTFSIFGRATSSIASNAQQVIRVREAEGQGDTASNCAQSTFRLLKSFFF